MINNSVCCVIVTYNIGRKFYECYNAISNQVEKTVIVDNGSNEETISVLKDLEKNENTVVIYNNENLGIATALNFGIKYAEKNNFKWVLTMDNDSIATNGMVAQMISSYEKVDDEKVVSLFPTYIDLGYNDRDNIDLSNREDSYIYRCADITSGNLIKTDIFKEIGYFEDKLFIDMVDYEFCFRLTQHGYKLIKFNKAVLLHNLGSMVKRKVLYRTITYTNHSYIRRYYITRNRFYIWNKYKGLKCYEMSNDKSAFIKELIKIAFFEKDKLMKFKMVVKGYKDYRRNCYGKLTL